MHPWKYPGLIPPEDAAQAADRDWEIAWDEPVPIPRPCTRAGYALLAMRAWRLQRQARSLLRHAAR